jgi:DNA polymerase-1
MTLLNINKNSKDIRGILVLPEKATQNLPALISNYLQPLGEFKDKVLIISAFTPDKGALKKSIADEEIEAVKEVAETYGVTNIFIANADYLKFFLKLKKKPAFERSIGSVFEIDGFKVSPVLNAQVLSFQPSKRPLLNTSIDTMQQVMGGTFVDNKEEFLDSLDIKLCRSYSEAYECLKSYMKCETISCDIETSGLLWHTDDLLTISFSKSETEGFCIALNSIYSDDWEKNRKLVKSFFENYKGLSVFHNGVFDVPFLVYKLWMSGLNDTKNMIKGVNCFNLVDTMVLAKLCLNSVDRVSLGLKDLSYSKYGAYDKDIEQKDLINYSFEEVGRYNTIDTCSTCYLYNKYSKMLVEEEQDLVYQRVYVDFLPALIKMKMNGITINKEGFEELKVELEEMYEKNIKILNEMPQVEEAVEVLKEKARKQKKSENAINKITFNPKSSQQLQLLLFEILGLPVLDKTKAGKPKADKLTLEALLKEVKEESEEWKILTALKEIGEMKNVLSTFVNGLLDVYVEDEFNNCKVFGDFNITGTISGRLSSKNPNLLNLPSNSRFGKAIKKNLIADKGYIIAQADYSALEDRIGASVTKDPAKIKIFTEGIDGHSLGAYYYFQREFKERGIKLDPSNPESINKVKELANDLRQKGKAVTFGASYGSSPAGIAKHLGVSLDEGQEIYDNYWKLYEVTKHYMEKVEQQVLKYGYATGAFGLKCRANLSGITDKGSYSATLRSINNFTIQSYALVNSIAMSRLQKRIEKAGLETKIKLINNIYDAQYYMVVPEPKIIKWLNDNLIECMLEPYYEMKDFAVKNEAELEIGKSFIAEEEIPNNATLEEVTEILQKVS